MSDVQIEPEDETQHLRCGVSGTPESAAWFFAQLGAIGQTKTGLAKWIAKRGDDRRHGTILRHLRRMASGEAHVSGEMRVILPMLRAGKKKYDKIFVKRQTERSQVTADTEDHGQAPQLPVGSIEMQVELEVRS